MYLLLLDQPQGSQPQPHVLVVSNLNLTLKAGERDALVWANDLQSGQPVPGLALEFFDSQGAALGNATTDADGVARIAIERTENRGVIALARQPFAAVASEWSNGISPGDFGLPASYGLPKIAAHVYTDRPIYRPGQTVNFKGVLRNEKDVNFSLPAGGKVQVTINSANGEQIFQQELALSANGSFDGSLKLADGAALGAYNINVTLRRSGRWRYRSRWRPTARRSSRSRYAASPMRSCAERRPASAPRSAISSAGRWRACRCSGMCWPSRIASRRIGPGATSSTTATTPGAAGIAGGCRPARRSRSSAAAARPTRRAS